jgi:hypothetical protein
MFGIEKVQINKNSWHFRWLKLIHFVSEQTEYHYSSDRGAFTTIVVKAPQSICPYFWMLVGSFLLTLIGIATAIVVIAAILLLVVLVLVLVMNVVLVLTDHPRDTLWILILAVMVLLVIKYRFVVRHYNFPKFPKRESPSTGLIYVVRNYIKAEKNKVCPLIEFVD